MDITSNTKLLGIFGHPVSHSLSPLMQNAAIRECGLDMVYLPFDIEERHIKDAVQAIRALSMVGVNVTIPHKEAVSELVDELSEEASLSCSVNTVVNKGGRLIGYNTDGEGFVRSLKRAGVGIRGRNILILGAGGAAKGIIASLIRMKPSRVVVSNRTVSRAEGLVDMFKARSGTAIEATSLSLETLKKRLKYTDLLINTTPVGMEGRGGLDIPIQELSPGSVVADIVYKPIKTRLLREAEGIGLRTVGGVGMLVEQGALSFELWTGHDAPRDVMERVVIKVLKGHED